MQLMMMKFTATMNSDQARLSVATYTMAPMKA